MPCVRAAPSHPRFGAGPRRALTRTQRPSQVSDFGGVTLSSTFDTSILVNPQLPETQRLLQWWGEQQRQGAVQVWGRAGPGRELRAVSTTVAPLPLLE